MPEGDIDVAKRDLRATVYFPVRPVKMLLVTSEGKAENLGKGL